MSKNAELLSASKDRANAVITENIINRVLDRKSYIPLRSSGQRKSKIFLGLVALLACLPIIAMIAQLTNYDSQGYEFVTLACMFLFMVIGSATLIVALLLLNGASARKTDEFVSDNEAILQHYFVDFIKAKLPHEDRTYSTMFEINTIVDDRSVDRRALQMVGLCRFKKSTTEISVTLRFNPSYSKLVVEKYDMGGLER